jgi:hypothetical protein
MDTNSFWWFALVIVIALILFDLHRIQTKESTTTVKQEPMSLDERQRRHPQEFEFVSVVWHQLTSADHETLKWVLYHNGVTPQAPVELLDMIYQHIIWEGIADGRCGYVGNPHSEIVSRLESCYRAVSEIVGDVPEAQRALGEKIAADVVAKAFKPNSPFDTDATRRST